LGLFGEASTLIPHFLPCLQIGFDDVIVFVLFDPVHRNSGALNEMIQWDYGKMHTINQKLHGHI
jgi:hypothetical protein